MPNATIRVGLEGVQVVPQGASEEHRLLRHQTQGRPQRGLKHQLTSRLARPHEADVSSVDAVDHDPPAAGFDDPKQR